MAPTALGRIIDSERLPTIPAVALQVIGLVQRPDAGIDELTTLIMRDPTLAARVLRTANSGFYGRSRSVTRVNEAVMVLGLRTVKTLALGFTLVDDLRAGAGNGLDHTWLWQRSILTAVLSRSVAARAAVDEQDDAFLGGLFSLLGVLAFESALGEEYLVAAAGAGRDCETLRELEQAAFGLDHGEVGEALAARWSLPPAVAAAVRFGIAPGLAPDGHRRVAMCVAAGAAGADVILGDALPRRLMDFREICRVLDITADGAEELLTAGMAEAATLGDTLDIPGTTSSIEEVMTRANQALLQLTMEAERENAALQAERHELMAQASTDALTGIANRRHFQEFLAEHFRLAARYGSPLSLYMVDLDRFKALNDTHGHLAGDAVLCAVAATMKAHLREADLLARFGGEEFVVVLPSTALEGARQSAERLRAAIQDTPVMAGALAIRVTASFGVTAFRQDGLMTPEWLVKEADLALYEAKSGGRNRVCTAGEAIANGR